MAGHHERRVVRRVLFGAGDGVLEQALALALAHVRQRRAVVAVAEGVRVFLEIV